MEQLAREYGSDYEGLISNWREIHAYYLDIVNSFLEKWAAEPVASGARDAGLIKIIANEVVVEVSDRETGKTFRRTLPMEYVETDNGIRLSGETMDGNPTHLAFLSEAGMLRMKDILGRGPDLPRCQ